MNALKLVFEMLEQLNGEEACLPATHLFNEGWMLRLLLKAGKDGLCGSAIPAFNEGERWSSEAMLASPFSQSRGKAYEGMTNADGVIGKFDWRPGTGEALHIPGDCRRFEVFEAKMYSKLSKGVRAASWYDQAVRNVACMAHALQEANLQAQNFPNVRLGFWVVAPRKQIEAGYFRLEMSPDSMRTKVKMRVEQFHGAGREQLELWRTEYFEPLLDSMLKNHLIGCISWEELIDSVSDAPLQKIIKDFYTRCQNPFQLANETLATASLLRGAVCEIAGREGIVVSVCKVGPNKSRVFDTNSSRESFLVDNRLLRPLNTAPTVIAIPKKSDRRYFLGNEVVVTSVGPCRSKVRHVSPPFSEVDVDNHRLELYPKAEN